MTPLTAAYSPGWGPSVGSKNICPVSEAPGLGEQESTPESPLGGTKEATEGVIKTSRAFN